MSELHQSELVLGHEKNDQTITLAVTESCAGIWISGKGDDSTIAIYKEKAGDQIAIGMYGKGDKGKGLNIALSLDQDNNPYLQLVSKDGETIMLSFANLKTIGRLCNFVPSNPF